VRLGDEPGFLPPLEATSHWILNDRLVGQLQNQDATSAANSDRAAAEKKPPPSDALGSGAADVIVIGSSQEDDGGSDGTFISQCDLDIDDSARSLTASGIAQDTGAETLSAASEPARTDDECCDELVYNFGEEEELLSQAAAAKWHEGRNAEQMLDESGHETCCPAGQGCPAQPSPAQELAAFLAQHNLDALLPSLAAHEVTSLGCLCMLTQRDIVCAAPPPLAPRCFSLALFCCKWWAVTSLTTLHAVLWA
jgi:hypothetical protein